MNGANVPAVNFTAQMVTITGTITPIAGGAGATVALAGSPTSATTIADAAGAAVRRTSGRRVYRDTVQDRLHLQPGEPDGHDRGASAAAIDFTATAVPTFIVSGTVSPAANGIGTTLTLSGSTSRTTSADASGSYSFSGVANGSTR